MFEKKFEKDALLEEAYKAYSDILENAIKTGRIDDPFRMVAFFLGLNLAENIMYQKLVDTGCTLESIEKSKEKIEGMSRDIIAAVKGKMVSPGSDEKI